ncbi:hypothetical protein MGG_08782 [Pyricularia oryzae 70-15]|uniref:Uncharacterized protein n=3 Tax=Pyricularia oryzae TaxID=318829 RepID=G4NFL7_PYRO7|nr:uncharacterized protein MGG_08782 [Pyricularia oryzae 70-15]EHA46824.1 hypothetical protein MGG_08782 [Pyricularia oryzae 70-15]ELQ40972.1 hypothetical protein OOU_Y34scaffold00312g24 [Pyricularia oryzae Y34]KAI7918642.1 hypothetical protein M0657_007498 [Pyricularia oryzae]KAI7926166.1 hypothetical protein M9X92_002911 [Pyricularia oryzae]
MASTTTTTITTPASVSEVLVDYSLHHSDSTPAAAKEEGQQTATASSSDTSNPPGYGAQYRRVPAHRPINRRLDQSQRAVYQNGGERVFITVMFGGLFINSTAAKLWNATLGRVNPGIFRYPVGGEM